MPTNTIFDIPVPEQATMLAELRAVRYGYFLSIHILLLLSAGKTPTEIASFLFCSRSSVYRAKAADEKGAFSFYWQTERDHTRSQLTPPRGSWHASVVSYLQLSPKFFGWCRTRWSSGDAFTPTENQTRYFTVAGDYSAHASSAWVCVQTSAPHRTG